jgi:hypothetical protein
MAAIREPNPLPKFTEEEPKTGTKRLKPVSAGSSDRREIVSREEFASRVRDPRCDDD